MKKPEKEKILIVDSKASRRDSLASRFRLQGYYLDISNSGFQALSQSEKVNYHTVIVFGSFFDMPSIELISLLRDTKSKNQLQILYVDRPQEKEEIVKFYDFGITDYLVYNDRIFGTILEKISAFKQAPIEPSKGLNEKS